MIDRSIDEALNADDEPRDGDVAIGINFPVPPLRIELTDIEIGGVPVYSNNLLPPTYMIVCNETHDALNQSGGVEIQCPPGLVDELRRFDSDIARQAEDLLAAYQAHQQGGVCEECGRNIMQEEHAPECKYSPDPLCPFCGVDAQAGEEHAEDCRKRPQEAAADDIEH